MCISFSNDGHLIASGSLDLTIKIWNFENGVGIEIRTLKGHTDTITCL